MVTIEERKSEEDFTVRVPNQEVWKAFQELTAFYLQVDEYEIGTMLGYLKTGDIDKFAEAYRKVLLELPSYHDLKDENSYHMMMLGMCTFLRRDYDVRSNRESGSGRGDILLYTKKPALPNLVLEFKYTKDHSKELEELALDAVRQIKEKNDYADMQGETVLIGESYGGYLARGILSRHLRKIDGLMLLCPVVVPEKEKRILPNSKMQINDSGFLDTLNNEEREGFCEYAVIANEITYRRYSLCFFF